MSAQRPHGVVGWIFAAGVKGHVSCGRGSATGGAPQMRSRETPPSASRLPISERPLSAAAIDETLFEPPYRSAIPPLPAIRSCSPRFAVPALVAPDATTESKHQESPQARPFCPAGCAQAILRRTPGRATYGVYVCPARRYCVARPWPWTLPTALLCRPRCALDRPDERRIASTRTKPGGGRPPPCQIRDERPAVHAGTLSLRSPA
jgi:hypothetical protein